MSACDTIIQDLTAVVFKYKAGTMQSVHTSHLFA